MDDLISRLSDLRSHYNCFNESEREAYHTLSEAIEELQEQKTGKWIPCSEGYPKMDERVLVNLDGKDDIRTWDCMANRGDSYFWEDEVGFFHEKYEVLYWMRIPKLSEGE